MGLISTFDIEANFWEVNPQFTVREPFKSLYKKDKSKDKNTSSKMMWFVTFCYDESSENIFRNIPLKDRQEVIGMDYMDNKDYYKENKKLLDDLIIEFRKLFDTPLTKHLRQWESLIEDRTLFLSTQKYDLENFEALDKMGVGTDKLVETFKKINNGLKQEEGNGLAKGGKMPSLSDSGEI